MTSTYDRTVRAALAETMSRFDLAEALATEIPPMKKGPSEDAHLHDYLRAARQAVIDAGGEPRSVETMREYRATALWVSGVSSTNFRWLPGASYTAHNEARKWGKTYDWFAALADKSVDGVRKGAGKPSPSRTPIADWTPEQRAEAFADLIKDPEAIEAAFADITVLSQAAEAVDRARQGSRHPQPAERKPADLGGVGEKMAMLAAFHTIRDRSIMIGSTLSKSTLLHSDEDYRDAVLLSVDFATRRLEAIREIAMGGESLDQALARMTAGGDPE